jgi:hypothetical protein
VIVDQ